MDFNNVSKDEFNAVVAGLQADVLKVAKSFERLAVQIRMILEVQKNQNELYRNVCERMNTVIEVQEKQTNNQEKQIDLIQKVSDRVNELEGGGEGEEWKQA